MSRVPRKDPHLDEILELLDIRLANASGDFRKAFSMLSSFESEFIDSEISKCTDFRYYAENYHVIGSEEEGFKTLHPFWDGQEIFYEIVVGIQAKKLPVKILVLKARQLGSSTFSEGLIFHRTMFREGCNTLVVAQDPGQADYLFGMSRTAYDMLPWWMRPEARYEAKGRYIVFDRKDPLERLTNPGLKSQVFVEAANKMCLCPGTMVLSVRGLIPIETVVPGDFVLDPACNPVKVVAAIERKSPNPIGKKVLVYHNAAFSVMGTEDHPILTVDGLKRLDELEPGSKVIIPFREITGNEYGTYIPRPVMSSHAFSRLHHIPVAQCTREWGFLCGLYLAEGSVGKNNGRAVSFALSSKEDHLAQRASRACGVKLSSPIRDGGSLVYRIHNSFLGNWLSQQFGDEDEKHLPEWVWKAGAEFCVGLFEGMLRGDGHFCRGRNDIVFVTKRPWLAVQVRELGLSLGFGLGGIMKSKTSWKYKGEKKSGVAYRVEFGGDVGVAIRSRLGVLIHDVEKHLRNHQKWSWMPGKLSVCVEVKSVEDCKIDVVYDIQVDSEAHLYLLPATITHNTGVAVGRTVHAAHMSELSNWPNDAILAEQIFPTMNAPDELAIMESTARGRKNFWHDFWVATVERKTEWTPIFIEWFRAKKYFLMIPEGVEFNLNKEEEGIKKRVKETSKIELTNEQFYWRRKKIQEFEALQGSEFKFYQEYCSTWMEAFQGTGVCAFSRKKLQSILETLCVRPRWYGEVTLDIKGEKQHPKIRLVEVDADTELPVREGYGGRLHVWEQPEEGETYYIGGDVAHGVPGGDFSVAQVLKIGRRLEPDVQVAEWRGWINPGPFGHVLVALGYWYNQAQLAIECNDVGNATNAEVMRVLQYENLFRWKHYDKIKNFMTDFFGWFTNVKTRDLIIAKFREFMDENMVIIRSEMLIDECFDFASVEGSRFEGQATKDDLVMSFMIALFCAHDSDFGIAASMTPRKNNPDEKNPARRKDFSNTDFSPFHDAGKLMSILPYEDKRDVPADFSLHNENSSEAEDAWKLL